MPFVADKLSIFIRAVQFIILTKKGKGANKVICLSVSVAVGKSNSPVDF